MKLLYSILFSPVKGQWKQGSVTKPPLPKSCSGGNYLYFYFFLIEDDLDTNFNLWRRFWRWMPPDQKSGRQWKQELVSLSDLHIWKNKSWHHDIFPIDTFPFYIFLSQENPPKDFTILSDRSVDFVILFQGIRKVSRKNSHKKSPEAIGKTRLLIHQ